MTWKGVIFDLDGTLLDTLRDLAEAANTALAFFDYPVHNQDEYRYFVGEGLKTLTRRILPDSVSDENDILLYMKKFEEVYKQNWNKHSAPYPGIPEMLADLKENGMQLAVLSNKPHEFTKICVHEFFPENTFSYVYGQRDGVPKKPDPAGAVELARRLGIDREEILYVGDTATDMQTGNSAGMKTIGVLWGFRNRRELEENNAWKIVTHPEEIVRYAA